MSVKNSCKIQVIPMTKKEFCGKEKSLVIMYSMFTVVSLGKFLVASTSKGICMMLPAEKRWNAEELLRRNFPWARFRRRQVGMHRKAASWVRQQYDRVDELSFHLYGTSFQLAVWKALLSIPQGKVTTYLDVARQVGNLRAARAVGGAVGSNPVMIVIPCHRVICSSGSLGGYHWGADKKVKLLNREARASGKMAGMSNWEPTFF